MEHGYVVNKENTSESDESEWGYPPYVSTIPICICETQESADKLIEKLKQDDADAFIDWLDENMRFLVIKQMDVDDYDEDLFHSTAEYYVREVPYYCK